MQDRPGVFELGRVKPREDVYGALGIGESLSGLPLPHQSLGNAEGVGGDQFLAAHLFRQAQKRTLGVAYKTAWYLCHRIREAVKDADTSLLSGVVECDETYVGGKAKNMHKDVRARKIHGRGASGKAMVLGAIERGGKVRLDSALTPDRETLRAFIAAKLADETTAIMTDDLPAYDGIADSNTRHEMVNHSKMEWVRGDVHTNTMEGVWSLFKRSIIGSYHQISVKHLDRYLDELEFRFNNRNNPYLFRDALLRLIASSNLEYNSLISNTRALSSS